MTIQCFDFAVIGGGVNGCGIARDAAGRGANVLLLEANDLASGTSSASTKLIHGGLRYLEHYEFGLVREALRERETLWAIAPHLIHPLRFVLPHSPALRPRWMLRLGLFLYDHIGGRKRLPKTQTLDLRKHPAGAVLQETYRHGFVYSDCQVDDARLVVLNARDAADRGATILTRCPVEKLERLDKLWSITTPKGSFQARAVVNAAGPSVLSLLRLSHEETDRHMRLVRGSHIVVPRLCEHGYAYFFQLPDGRIIFAIPWHQDFTLIGTTDRDHQGDLSNITASDDEIAYLCDGVNLYFKHKTGPADVIWSFAGVRPLVDEGGGKPEAATRGYKLELSAEEEGAPILTVFGGKITTYRHLAERAVELLEDRLPELAGTPWTGAIPLPGGNFDAAEEDRLREALRERFPFLPSAQANRMFRAYGTRCHAILGQAASLSDLGIHFGHGLYEREVRHLIADEWAETADDILWRRSKLGLRFDERQTEALTAFLAKNSPLQVQPGIRGKPLGNH